MADFALVESSKLISRKTECWKNMKFPHCANTKIYHKMCTYIFQVNFEVFRRKKVEVNPI